MGANISTTITTDPAMAGHADDRLEAIAKDIESLQTTAIMHVAERLAEAREIFRYRRDEGGFAGWVEARLRFSRQTAYNLLHVHERFGGQSVKYLDTFPASVLYALSAPSTPAKARDEIIERAQAGEPVTGAEVKQTIETAKGRQQPVKRDLTPPEAARPERGHHTIIQLRRHDGQNVSYELPKAKATFNRTNEQVSWAAWTWNPVTGCLHNCAYCYARELANSPSYKKAYPAGFKPLFHHERLDAPKNTRVPKVAKDDPCLGRVFVVSMGDLYGKWVPQEWIEQVHASCIANPQWEYLMLTKFPQRYVGMQLPRTAWLGTTVDEQHRVKIAEAAFRKISGVRVKWLSLEPLLAPLEFSDLSMFDWIVIGSQSATRQPTGYVPEFAPPFEWVARIVAQAREAKCRIYMKPNLLGVCNPQSAGMKLIQEEPAFFDGVTPPPTGDEREAKE